MCTHEIRDVHIITRWKNIEKHRSPDFHCYVRCLPNDSSSKRITATGVFWKSSPFVDSIYEILSSETLVRGHRYVVMKASY